jgi:hypothetical protein
MYNQSNEGQFLINGVLVKNSNSLPNGVGDFAYTSGLTSNDIIKCNMSSNTLERTTAKYGEKTLVDYTKLENIIPGFHFLKSPCNPCNENPLSCPFKIRLKKN